MPMLRIVAVLVLALASSGCASIAVTLAGLGAGIGANHFIGNVTHRTFTASMADVKFASMAALKRMEFEIESVEATDKGGELIRARTSGREVEIEVEPLSPRATRMRSVVRLAQSLTLDGATASEIVAQTERGVQARGETVHATLAPPPALKPVAADVRGWATTVERDAGAIIADQENLNTVAQRELKQIARESLTGPRSMPGIQAARVQPTPRTAPRRERDGGPAKP
jgi:hypothetical protein